MLKIRKARLADLQTLVSLWKQLSRHHVGFGADSRALRPHLSRRQDAARNFAKWVQQYIGSRSGVVYFAEVDGRPVGYSLIFIKQNLAISKVNRVGYISDLFVKEGFRGQGIGSKLTNEALKWFRGKGIRHVSLHVLEKNRRPQSIYRKWGFFPFLVEMRKNL